MSELTKEELEGQILHGATLADIGRALNCGWQEALRLLDDQGIQPPSAARPTAQDLVVAQYLRAAPEGPHFDVQALIDQLQYPKLSHQIDPFAIYERFHGPGYTDAYSGQTADQSCLRFLNVVGGRPRTFLVSNMEVTTPETRSQRFSDYMPPIAESFRFRFGVEPNLVSFTLTVSRPYDRIVGGTYSMEYMRQIFDRWVGHPWRQYAQDDPEYERVLPRTPFELAWWAFIQITHYGLLKGLVELRVRDDTYGSEAVLSDDIVQLALMGQIARDGSPLIAAPQKGPKFDPSILLR